MKIPLKNKKQKIEYVSFVTNDPFHPGHLVTILQDKNDISSTQLLGYGIYDGHRCPIVLVQFNNGAAEQVFDEYACLLEI